MSDENDTAPPEDNRPQWEICFHKAREIARQNAATKAIEADAREVAEKVRASVAPAGTLPPEQGWLAFAPMPSDLCRVSPFFPMNPSRMGQREFVQNMLITKSAWGEIAYTGPKLSIIDEDVLLAVLAILDARQNREEVEHEGAPTLAYRGPILPLLAFLGVKKSGQAYKRVLDALERMTVAGLKLKTKRGNWTMSAILAAAQWDEEEKILSVVVNPYFRAMYAGGAVSLLDVGKRAALSRPISKALFRFIQSHRDKRWSGHFLTLAASLNLDTTQPHYETRRALKLAVAELKKHGILAPKSGFGVGADVVTLIRLDEPRKAIA